MGFGGMIFGDGFYCFVFVVVVVVVFSCSGWYLVFGFWVIGDVCGVIVG